MCSSAIAADWHKPDNTANLFVAVSGETDPHVFRVTMELYDTVSQHFLQKALEQTLPYFRAFNVKFKRHFFQACTKHNIIAHMLWKKADIHADSFRIRKIMNSGSEFFIIKI